MAKVNGMRPSTVVSQAHHSAVQASRTMLRPAKVMVKRCVYLPSDAAPEGYVPQRMGVRLLDSDDVI
jgi:hypothetical protein